MVQEDGDEAMSDAVRSTIELTDGQQEVLNWIKDGCPDGVYPKDSYVHRGTARGLHNRDLVRVSGHGATWTAVPTERGMIWPEPVQADLEKLERDRVAKIKKAEEKRAATEAKREAVKAAKARQNPRSATSSSRVTNGKQSAVSRRRRGAIKLPPEPEFEVISPAEARRHGKKPRGDRLTGGEADPWDEKIMITVKEAAWMLSLQEGAIREAVRDGDVQRVFIGSGTTNYRIVYGSLLAWVDSMPREPGIPKPWWQ